MAKVKCRFCKTEIDKETAYKVGKASYYCNEECYKKTQEKKAKPKKNNNDSPMRDLTDYIQELYIKQGYEKNQINWALIGSQIKNLMEENKNWTYGGIKYTLKYMIDNNINVFDFQSGSILNLVPFYYNEAKDFCYFISDLYDELENITDDKIEVIKTKSKTNKGVKIDLKF